MSGFDIEGAKKAGYSEAEIADHLAAASKFDSAGARQAGYSDADIISHLGGAVEPKSSAKLGYERVTESVRNTVSNALGQKPMTAPQEMAWDATMNNGFGTGVPKFAYQQGGKVVDALADKGTNPKVAAGIGAATDALIQAMPSFLTPTRLGPVSDAEQSARALAAQRQSVLEAGKKLGIVVPPSQVNPGIVNRMLESTGGKYATAQQASVKNENTVYLSAQRESGLAPSQPLNTDNLEAARKTLSAPYREVANLQSAGPFSQPPFKSPAQTLEDLKDARAEAKAQWEYYERSKLPQALRDSKAATAKAEQIEQALEQQAMAAGSPDLVSRVREARTALAKNFTVERAMRGSSFEPAALSRMAGSNSPLSGDLDTIMQMYRDFPKAMAAPQVGGSVGVNQLMPWLGGTAGGIGGALLHGPVGAGVGTMAGMVASQTIPPAARALILSPLYQSLMANVPQGASSTPALLRALGVNPALGALYSPQ